MTAARYFTVTAPAPWNKSGTSKITVRTGGSYPVYLCVGNDRMGLTSDQAWGLWVALGNGLAAVHGPAPEWATAQSEPRCADRTYTHPDVLDKGVREGWADPRTDPTQIDWVTRQAQAAIAFRVVQGRPVNPYAPTGIRYGRNELGHWGEQMAADAVVTATDEQGARWLVMVERSDGHGWALPGGYVDPGENPAAAAVRELREETGLALDGATWQALPARYVPDPRASDEAWMVTVPATVHLGTAPRKDFPVPAGADDAKRAVWVRADSYAALAANLASTYHGQVFAAHRLMLAELLGPDLPEVAE